MNSKVIWVRTGFLAVLFLILAGIAAPPALAQITWSGPSNVSGDSDVYTGGVSQYAYAPGGYVNYGSGWSFSMPQTVNGVLFQRGNSSTNWGNNVSLSNIGTQYNWYDYNNGYPPGLSTAYNYMLAGANYGNSGTATVTLNNLVAGQHYAVQIWAQDPRACCDNRTETVFSTGGGTITLAYNATQTGGGAGQYSVGTFTASGTSQSFYLGSGIGGTQLNAISLEAIVPSINWSSAQNIAGAADVSIAGSAVYAYNWNGNASTTGTETLRRPSTA